MRSAPGDVTGNGLIAVPITFAEQTPNGHRLARTRMHARREIIEEFRLGSVALPARPMVSGARRYHADHADIGAGLDEAA
jgi:hypothetical protein